MGTSNLVLTCYGLFLQLSPGLTGLEVEDQPEPDFVDGDADDVTWEGDDDLTSETKFAD